MILHIKNMVCNRCILVVKNELEKFGHLPLRVELGEVELRRELSPDELEAVSDRLSELGFELISDRAARLIEQIKKLIIAVTNDHDLLQNRNLSNYISLSLNREYSVLSKLFSESENTTIEQYYILQKIEKVKEWLAYGELNLTEIAWKLGYSSVAHLSGQFRKVTGLTPSHFRNLRSPLRKPIDKII